MTHVVFHSTLNIHVHHMYLCAFILFASTASTILLCTHVNVYIIICVYVLPWYVYIILYVHVHDNLDGRKDKATQHISYKREK